MLIGEFSVDLSSHHSAPTVFKKHLLLEIMLLDLKLIGVVLQKMLT